MTKFLNISTDNTLGGNSPSDVLVSSQKAIKEYVDAHGGGGSVAIDDSTITKNSSNEIQAVATANANTASGSTNPLYDWVGTLAEYTSQAVATNHPDWVCCITDDCEATSYQAYTQSQCNNLFVQKGHQVIAFQESTAANNYTWYRKYADGWVEQGGRTSLNSGISSSNKQITFPIEMANSNYYANVSQDANAGAQLVMHGWQHTTYMTIGTNSVTSTGYVEWEVKGMAA